MLVTDLRSAFSSADENENKVQAHSAMLELSQRKEESSLGELDVPLSSPIQNMTISSLWYCSRLPCPAKPSD